MELSVEGGSDPSCIHHHVYKKSSDALDHLKKKEEKNFIRELKFVFHQRGNRIEANNRMLLRPPMHQAASYPSWWQRRQPENQFCLGPLSSTTPHKGRRSVRDGQPSRQFRLTLPAAGGKRPFPTLRCTFPLMKLLLPFILALYTLSLSTAT